MVLFSEVIGCLLRPRASHFIGGHYRHSSFVRLQRGFPFFSSFRPQSLRPSNFNGLLLIRLLVFSRLVGHRLGISLRIIFLVGYDTFGLSFLGSVYLFFPRSSYGSIDLIRLGGTPFTLGDALRRLILYLDRFFSRYFYLGASFYERRVLFRTVSPPTFSILIFDLARMQRVERVTKTFMVGVWLFAGEVPDGPTVFYPWSVRSLAQVCKRDILF